jgi:hypothetical protein
VSLSGGDRPELPRRFLELKKKLVAGREDSITASWQRLLQRLRVENEIIAQKRSDIIPQLKFESLDRDSARLRSEIRKRGAAVVRGIIPVSEARRFKEEAEEYIKQNPKTKGITPGCLSPSLSFPSVPSLFFSFFFSIAFSYPISPPLSFIFLLLLPFPLSPPPFLVLISFLLPILFPF